MKTTAYHTQRVRQTVRYENKIATRPPAYKKNTKMIGMCLSNRWRTLNTNSTSRDEQDHFQPSPSKRTLVFCRSEVRIKIWKQLQRESTHSSADTEAIRPPQKKKDVDGLN